jgi:hypothetical protein
VRLTTKLSGIVAVGGVAALGAGLISSGGIGAAYTDTATATGTLNTGTMHCQLADSTGGLHISGDASAVTFDLGQIKSSADGSQFGSVKVKNTGTMGLVASWSIVDPAAGVLNATQHISPIQESHSTTADQMFIPAGQTSSDAVPVGFAWANLDEADQGKSLAVTYKVSCFDSQTPPLGTALLGHDGGYATWDGTKVVANILNKGQKTGAPGAGIFITNPAALVADSPEFTFATNDPKHDGNTYSTIRFTNNSGGRVIAHGFQVGSTSDWSVSGDVSGTGWSAVTGLFASGWTPASAYVAADDGNPAGTVREITCLKYAGTYFVGDNTLC